MKRLAVLVLVSAALAAPPAHSADKVKKPRLDVRATPRMAFSPVRVLLTAELTGGGDVEEYYCPEIEWDWDDGGKSLHEADCKPFEPGTKIERRFTTELIPIAADHFGQPEDIARMVALLASPLSGYMTSANYRVVGGQCRSDN